MHLDQEKQSDQPVWNWLIHSSRTTRDWDGFLAGWVARVSRDHSPPPTERRREGPPGSPLEMPWLGLNVAGT